MTRWFILISLISLLIGCSQAPGGSSNPVAPPVDTDIPTSQAIFKANTHLWGFYEVIFNPDSESVEMIL